MFHGSMVALVTPMLKDGTVDVEKLRQLVEWHINHDTDAIVVVGTTGESATLTAGERALIIQETLQQAKGRVPIIAGTGTNCTATTIQLTKDAMALKVDACLLITPYCNKPTQEGLFQHHKAVAEAVPIPQILYNVPSRTACDLKPETVGRLSAFSNIIGIKEATGDLNRIKQTLDCSQAPIDFYSGDDLTAKEFMLTGGKGVISVVANVAPKLMHAMCVAALSGDKNLATRFDEKLIALHKQLFIETNPIPCKWALQQMGLIQEGIRLPLTPLSQMYHQTVRDALRAADISLGD